MKDSLPLLDALTMGLMNLAAAAVLIVLHVINAAYDWTNPFVTVAAPLGAAVFLVLSAVWCLESARRARVRRMARGSASVAVLPIRLSRARPVLFDHRHDQRQTWCRLARSAWGRHRAGHARSA